MKTHAAPKKSSCSVLLDVTSAAKLLGLTPKALRRRIDRRTIPFKKLGRRIMFVQEELWEFIATLEGCSCEEANTNLTQRGLS